MDLVEAGIAGLGNTVSALIPAGWLHDLIIDGIIAGVGSVLVFLPQILILFAFILALEASGYMARAAFLMDELMARIGLSGRALIPLLSSFACAIPGIMSARTIESERDRLTTIMIAPLMTCSARLPVYTLIIAAFIPPDKVGILNQQGLVLFALYMAGVLSSILVAFIMKRTITKGASQPLMMELPTYKLPQLRDFLLGLWSRFFSLPEARRHDHSRDFNLALVPCRISCWKYRTLRILCRNDWRRVAALACADRFSTSRSRLHLFPEWQRAKWRLVRSEPSTRSKAVRIISKASLRRCNRLGPCPRRSPSSLGLSLRLSVLRPLRLCAARQIHGAGPASCSAIFLPPPMLLLASPIGPQPLPGFRVLGSRYDAREALGVDSDFETRHPGRPEGAIRDLVCNYGIGPRGDPGSAAQAPCPG